MTPSGVVSRATARPWQAESPAPPHSANIREAGWGRRFRPDERQRAQQALFLCPNWTHWGVGFETSLKNVLQRPADAGEHWLYKIKIRPQARDELLDELRRMRISYECLFPGLDRFVKSLRTFVSVRSDHFDYFRNGFDPII
jgi:hypothetical protein